MGVACQHNSRPYYLFFFWLFYQNQHVRFFHKNRRQCLNRQSRSFLMSGPQFAHIQTWSRKPNKAGQSIDHIIAEANRDPEFSTHVENPAPPRFLLGNPATFAADHAAHVAARSTIAIMADGSQKSRAIRTDRHTMASIVMSYPVPRSAIVSDEAKAKLAAWEQRNLDWLRESYGDQLRVALAHDDENHPHLHAWLLPEDPGADATTLHPGKVAKKEVEARAKAENVENREAVKLGNRALKAAMTIWQDEYHAAVGGPEGLTRSGPKRRRLSREQWQAEKATAQAHKAALERAEGAQASADTADLRVIAAEARVEEIDARDTATAERVRRLEKVQGNMKRREKQMEARKEAVAMREEAVAAREGAATAKELQSDGRAAQIIEKATREAEKAAGEAEALRAEMQAECLKMAEGAHEERRKISQFIKRVRDVVGRIGSALGLDLLGKDLMQDLASIEEDLVAAENPAPEADRNDGPEV
jgi:flagellar biosynthesis GTPase FlhF